MNAPVRRPLSRPRVLQAALRLVDRDGLERLSMRRLGAELGVEAMSLYNHVPSKGALLDGVVELTLHELKIPPADAGSWQERVRDSARGFRRLAHTHPQVFPLFATRPLATPESLRPVDEVLGILREGLDDAIALNAFRTLVGYVIGFALVEIGAFLGHDGDSAVSVDPATLPTADFPHLASLASHVRRVDPDQEFEFGLDAIIAGLEALAAAARPAAG